MTKYLIRLLVLIGLCSAGSSFAASNDDPEKSAAWPAIKAALFADDPDIPYDDVISLETPIRAIDAAITPIEVRTNISQDDNVFIEKIYLIIDSNPSPVVGEFEFSKLSGNAGFATVVRVNAYSFVRAIAKTSDGKYHMTANFVKASGGCSAPASGDDEALVKNRGKMKLRHHEKDGLVEMKLMIKHPNYSGLQVNQVNQQWIPADFVNKVDISLDDKPVLRFSGGISFSENPSIRFYMKRGLSGNLSSKVTDSQDRFYAKQWPLEL